MTPSHAWILERHRFQGIRELGATAQAHAIRLAFDRENATEIGMMATKEYVVSFDP
jgi:hypothetical protein